MGSHTYKVSEVKRYVVTFIQNTNNYHECSTGQFLSFFLKGLVAKLKREINAKKGEHRIGGERGEAKSRGSQGRKNESNRGKSR